MATTNGNLKAGGASIRGILVLLLVVTMVGISDAQDQNRGSTCSQGCSPACFGPYAAGYTRHSSTAAEGRMRGVAAMIEAQGRYNLLTSLAIVNMIEAQRLQIENHQRRVEAYYALREANRHYRDAENEARRQRTTDVVRNQNGHPKQGAAAEVATVAIQWPTMLEEPNFAGYRKLVERLAAKRANGSEPTKAECSRLAQANRVVLAVLKNAPENTTDRDAAGQFVKNLAKGHSPEPTRLATNP
jgi:hypothetical protein